MQRLPKLTLAFWLFIKTFVSIIAFIITIEAHNFIPVLVSSFKLVLISNSQAFLNISFGGWDKAFLSFLITNIILTLVMLVFLLIFASLVKSFSHKLNGGQYKILILKFDIFGP